MSIFFIGIISITLIAVLLVALGYHWVWAGVVCITYLVGWNMFTVCLVGYLSILTLLGLWSCDIHDRSVMCMLNKHKPYRSGTFHGMAVRTKGKRGLININNAIYSCSECGQELYREPNLE